jgi:hypothetical protein
MISKLEVRYRKEKSAVVKGRNSITNGVESIVIGDGI